MKRWVILLALLGAFAITSAVTSSAQAGWYGRRPYGYAYRPYYGYRSYYGPRYVYRPPVYYPRSVYSYGYRYPSYGVYYGFGIY